MIQATAHLIHQCFEVINIFKAPVHAGESNVCDFVELFKLKHDQFTNSVGCDLSQAKIEEGFLDAFNGVVHLFGTDRALS